MSKSKETRKPITAAELMSQLNQNEDFVHIRQQEDEKFKAREKQFREAEEPLVKALNDLVGVSVISVSDLVNSSEHYPQAIPALVIHLGYGYPHQVREAIARALTVEYAGEHAYKALVREFRKLPDSKDAAQHGLKWALGNAISVTAGAENFDEVVELVEDQRHGSSRGPMVLRLPRLSPSRSVGILLDLLNDDEVAGQAIAALGKVRATEARQHIERFLTHPKGWVRNEAIKALRRLKEQPPQTNGKE
jgi:hypothetical protein